LGDASPALITCESQDENPDTIPSKVGELLGILNDLFEGKGYYCMTTLPIGLS